MRGDFPESDWQIFRGNIAAWQERYMDKLNKEYIELLNSDCAPSEKFWTLYERMQKDKNKAGVQVRRSRSKLLENMVALVREGAVSKAELSEFSDGLQSAVKILVG